MPFGRFGGWGDNAPPPPQLYRFAPVGSLTAEQSGAILALFTKHTVIGLDADTQKQLGPEIMAHFQLVTDKGATP